MLPLSMRNIYLWKLHELSTMSIANKQTLATAKNLIIILSSILCVCLKLQPSHINCHPDTNSPLGNITISPNLAILPDKLCFVWISTRDTNLRKFNLPKYHRYGIELRTTKFSSHALICILLSGDIATNPGPNTAPSTGLNVLYLNARSIKAFVPLDDMTLHAKFSKCPYYRSWFIVMTMMLSLYVKHG